MFSLSPHALIHWLSHYPPEILSMGMFGVCVVLILLMMRIFGAAGLMVYACVAVLVANIEVLKTSYFPFFHGTVALGTVVFSSIFLVSDILTEYYGKSYAQKTVGLSFSAVLMVMLLMMTSLAFKPVGSGAAHNAMAILFTPIPALLVASLGAYAISQLSDIWIFSFLSRMTAGKLLWLRTLLSTLMGAFIDNAVFSTLAWVVFAPQPLSWNKVFYTYILGTYIIRVCIALAGIPLLYVARLFVKK